MTLQERVLGIFLWLFLLCRSSRQPEGCNNWHLWEATDGPPQRKPEASFKISWICITIFCMFLGLGFSLLCFPPSFSGLDFKLSFYIVIRMRGKGNFTLCKTALKEIPPSPEASSCVSPLLCQNVLILFLQHWWSYVVANSRVSTVSPGLGLCAAPC